jgi:hypothetical protein
MRRGLAAKTALSTEARVACAFAAVAALVALVACASPVSERTFLQASDLVAESDGFDRNEIIDTASFIDAKGIDAAQIQQLLDRTPYGHASFLSTYSSNGVRADDAIIRAALKYQINPLVFLVEAEVAEGLVGEEFYPVPPSRVEYVFDCGCAAPGDCDPSLAGFDVQVDCLGRQLRASLDQIAASGGTIGGWSPGTASTTVDGQSVNPADAATAALYQYLPKVATNQAGGNWLVWNVWQIYSTTAMYFGPIGNPVPQTAWVGDGCTGDATCAYANGICATNYPGGMCTAQCMQPADCPSNPMEPPTFCADFQQSGYCLVICDPTQSGACRPGYTCKSVQGFMASGTSQNVCVNM